VQKLLILHINKFLWQSNFTIQDSLTHGYLLIYDFNKNKEYKEETYTLGNKEIFAVWV